MNSSNLSDLPIAGRPARASPPWRKRAKGDNDEHEDDAFERDDEVDDQQSYNLPSAKRAKVDTTSETCVNEGDDVETEEDDGNELDDGEHEDGPHSLCHTADHLLQVEHFEEEEDVNDEKVDEEDDAVDERDEGVADEGVPVPLVAAARTGDLQSVLLHLKVSSWHNETIRDAFYEASQCGQTRIACALLESLCREEDCNWCERHGEELWYALCDACARGECDLIRALLDVGVDLNDQSMWCLETHPLVVACQNGHLEAVSMMLNEYGADPNARDDDSNLTSLTIACAQGNAALFDMLVTAGADVNQDGLELYTPLMVACKYDRLALVTRLLELGATVDNENTENYETPVHLALENAHVEVLRRLEEFGAEVPIDTELYDNVLLFVAKERGDVLLYSHIQERVGTTLSVHDTDHRGRTATWWACAGGHADLYRHLASAGGSVSADFDGKTPFWCACESGSRLVVAGMLCGAVGPPLTEQDWNVRCGAPMLTPFEVSCASGHIEVVRLLLAARKAACVDSNARSDADELGDWLNMSVALVAAAYNNHPDIVELLILSGARPPRKLPDAYKDVESIVIDRSPQITLQFPFRVSFFPERRSLQTSRSQAILLAAGDSLRFNGVLRTLVADSLRSKRLSLSTSEKSIEEILVDNLRKLSLLRGWILVRSLVMSKLTNPYVIARIAKECHEHNHPLLQHTVVRIDGECDCDWRLRLGQFYTMAKHLHDVYIARTVAQYKANDVHSLLDNIESVVCTGANVRWHDDGYLTIGECLTCNRIYKRMRVREHKR